MIIVELLGGLGNQMFQYAMGKSLSKHLNTPVKYDVKHLVNHIPNENLIVRDLAIDVFNTNVQHASQKEIENILRQSPHKIVRLFENVVMGRKNKYKYLYEPQPTYFEDVYKLPVNSYLAGYWQSTRYFENIEPELKREFTFKAPIIPESHDLLQRMNRKTPICINVRRFNALESSFHGYCGVQYYMTAMDIIASKVSDPDFFIFSDDLNWCKENLKIEKYPFTIVGHEHKGDKFSNYLHLMSLCKHFIIPNSSFAWWATWLNTDKDKIVIVPQTWHLVDWDPADLILPGWIRVKNN